MSRTTGIVQCVSVILIASSTLLQIVSGYAHLSDPARKWPNGIVYYKIDDSLSSFVPEIQRAITHIEANTCIRYVERTDQPNYISLRLVTDMGCTAPIGYQGNGEQRMTVFEPECGFFSYFVHQLIQQLGMNHEHQRSDRDQYITVDTSNVDPESVRYFDKLDANAHVRSSVYDFDSIMHYGSLRFSNNGKATMLYLNGSRIKDLQDKTELSPLDIIGINTHYHCPDNSSAHQLSSAFTITIAMGLWTMFRLVW